MHVKCLLHNMYQLVVFSFISRYCFFFGKNKQITNPYMNMTKWMHINKILAHLKSNDDISAALKDNDNIIASPKNPHLIATYLMQNQVLTTCTCNSPAIHPATCFYWAFTADSCIVLYCCCPAIEVSMSFLIVLSM